MKKIITALFLLWSTALYSKNIYISSAGSDVSLGTNPLTAWRTISKLNSAFSTIVAGDSILFRRGDTFYGQVLVTKSGSSGNPIVFSSYGTGNNPVITGLVTISGWVNIGTNIWEAPTTGISVDVNLVLRDNIVKQVGRFPNASSANKGYLIYTSSTTTSITGSALSTTTNWTGAEVAVRHVKWDMRKRKVLTHVGGRVTFDDMGTTPKPNYGYFFQRDARTLDQDGEWFQNGSTNKMRMYFSNNDPSVYVVKAASIDTLFKSNQSNITIDGVDFNGSDKVSVMNRGGTNIIIRNCNVTNSGGDAITTWFSSSVTVNNCTVDYSLGSGIKTYASSSGTANLSVTNCTINHTAYIAGMKTGDVSSAGKGITVNGGSNITVTDNVIKNSGYNGITWQGDNVLIIRNLIDTFCTVLDDGAGIYTYENAGPITNTRSNRFVKNNIILYGIGAPEGSSPAEYSANGIYNDEGTRNVELSGNTVAYMPYNGINGNNNENITIKGNTIFKSQTSFSFQRLSTGNLMRGFSIHDNIFYPYQFRYRNLSLNTPSAITKEADIQEMMDTLDNNYYSVRAVIDSAFWYTTTNNGGGGFASGYNNINYIKSTLGFEIESLLVANNGTLEYNASSSDKTISFPGFSKKDVQGNTYDNSLVIPAWSSKVLFDNGSTEPNIPPVVDAGPDQNITLPIDYLTVTGTATPIGAGVFISFVEWTGVDGVILTPDNYSTLIQSLTEGDHTFTFTATDTNGESSNDSMIVHVNPEVPTPAGKLKCNCIFKNIP